MTVGKEGISAKIICDSISNGNRLTTFELEYPRFILAEINTHRMLSKNSASSRAIPASKMLEQIKENPARPVWWGKNQPGMQAKEELNLYHQALADDQWLIASRYAIEMANNMIETGLHKQITNRITEPWQRMKTVATGTEWANLLWLRDHEDAQPEFGELVSGIFRM
jgi:thymidylate synthase ThyX